MNRLLCCALVVLSGCFDLEVPASPPPTPPGTVQGTLVYAVPGRPSFQPAVGARLELLRTGLTASAGVEGRFMLGGVVQSAGTLLATLDVDGDGTIDRQRQLSLDGLGIGAGRDVVLGQVVLSRNGSVTGRVQLADVAAPRGHGGITVFVPGGPWATYSADDGSYVLDGLPEGSLQVAFFKTGYELDARDTTLGAGEDRSLPTLQLRAQPNAPASLLAKIVTSTQAPAGDARVTLRHLRVDQALPVSPDGVLSQRDLEAGVYSLSIERTGALPIALYNVGLPPGETDLGTLTLLDGVGAGVTLGGLGPWGGPGDAGVVDAGVVDAGVVDAGVVDAGVVDAGVVDAGVVDAGVDAGADAGADAGVDGGMPIAIVTGPALAAGGTQVTVSGMSSTGDLPLTFRWSQLTGPAITFSANNTPLAHSPQFTAPAAGNVVEVQLVVEDRLGFSSAPAVLRVGIGVTPVARFSPDAGRVFGSQLVPLTSTSFDDAGVPLVAFDWQLATGAPGSLIADGGPTALWRAPAVAFGSPDVLSGVRLQVTNAVGARSGVFTNFYTVTGANPDNWAIDAGPSRNVVVGPVPPQVVLSANVASLIPSPQYSVSWSCPPGVTVLDADTLNPRFLAPVIVGPTQLWTCQVVATGQPPLDPLTVSDTIDLFLEDHAPPTLVSSSVEATRVGRFGVIITASEPLSVASVGSSCSLASVVRLNNRSAVLGPQYPVPEGTLCGSFNATTTDTAPALNQSFATFGPGAVLTVQTQWSGPWESTGSFDDPRPVVSALGQLPREQQARFGVTPGTPPGFELVATQGSDLVRFTGLDPSTRPSCEPSCPLGSSQLALSLSTGATAGRAHFGGAELFVLTSLDAGTQVARRGATGTWSRDALAGMPGNWVNDLRTARFEPDGGQLLVELFSPADGSFVGLEQAAAGVSTPSLLTTADGYVVAAVGASRQLFTRKRTAPLVWTTITQPSPPQNLTSLRTIVTHDGVAMAVYESPSGLSMQRIDQSNYANYLLSSTAVTGYDLATWGGQLFLVYALNGDVRFKWVTSGQLAGGGGPVDFPGPPRAGFTAPFPLLLDANPLCEAAWPSLAFVEDALVITWQERCPPATQWKVMSRVVR